MTFELAIRVTEILLSFALIQQSIEYLTLNKKIAPIYIARILLSVLLLFGYYSSLILLILLLISIYLLNRFQGPYNGGSDKMSLLILICLNLTHLLPNERWQELAFGYLALQLILSYFMAGWVKIKNSDWRSGKALQDVFEFSLYPTHNKFRALQHYPKTLFILSWYVILLELLFPLLLLSQKTMILALSLVGLFHLSNAYLFGLNRFFWVWIAAYPSVIWLQDKVILNF